MVDWKQVAIGVLFCILLFFAIPIKISNVEQVEERVLFDTFCQQYNKTYSNESEYERRFTIFEESLKQIKVLNSNRSNASVPSLYGITYFSDMDKQEFDDIYLNYEHKKNSHSRKRVASRFHHHHSNRVRREIGGDLPRSIDWRQKRVISEVKNQKTCGACWAFSTVETIESMYAIKTGKLLSFSTQEIIDCARNGNMGCDGGDTCNLLDWLVTYNIAIQKEIEYPLILQTGTCKLKPSASGVYVASNFSCDYLVSEEETILALLAYHGPVVVAVNALTWQFYIGGVIQFHCDGALESLNHAVQLVGYNLDASPPYYIARNSWGKLFGEKGYLRIAIGSNICGIASEVAALDVI